MKKKTYLVVALLLALTVSSGAYAYTYSTASNVIAIAEPTGDIAAISEAENGDQPDWDDILPEGDYYIEYLLPNAAGDITNLDRSDCTQQNWELVDDMPADDSLTYVSNSHHNQYWSDLYELTDYVDAVGYETINSITVHFRVSGSPEAKARAIIRIDEEDFTGNEEILHGGSYTDMSYQWTNNPATDETWTWDDINDLQAGISLQGVQHGGPTTCTQVYVVVDYYFVIAEGDVPEGDLYEITPHPEYPGDLSVKLYMVNTGALIKAYQYLNMKISLESANEEFQVLSLDNGVATFCLEGFTGDTLPLSITGGSYRLISGDTDDWGEGWNITPEFYCEVKQR